LLSYESGKLKQRYLVIKLDSSILPVCKDLNEMCRAYLRVMSDYLHFNCGCLVMTRTAFWEWNTEITESVFHGNEI